MPISAAQLVAVVTADTLGAEASLGRVGRAFERVGAQAEGGAVAGISRFERATKGLGIGVALAAGAVGAFSVREAIQFQAAMAKVQGLTGASAAEVGKFKEQILGLSGQVAQKPKDLADALYFIESGGLHGAKALSVLRMSAEDASSGLGTTHDIVQTLVGSMNAYSKSNLTARQASDDLVAAVTQGHMPANELARALGRVQGTTASLGISFPELLANIATLTKTSMSSSQAATSIQSVGSALVRMLDPSKKVAGALSDIGLTGKQVNIELRDKGLRSTLQDLTDRTDRYAKAHGGLKDAIVRLFPNVRALRDVLGTAGVQGKVYADVLKHIEDATKGAGRTAEAFAVTQKTVAFQIKQVRATISELAIRLGDLLLPAVSKVLGGFLHLVQYLESHHKVWIALRDAVGVILVGALTLALRAVALFAIAWAPAILAAAAVAAAIGLVVVGIRNLYQHSAPFRHFVQGVATDLKDLWKGLTEGNGHLSAHASAWERAGAAIRSAVDRWVRQAKTDLTDLNRGLLEGSAHLSAHANGWERAGARIHDAAMKMRDGIREAYEWIRGELVRAVGWVHDHADKIRAALTAVGDFLRRVYQVAVKFAMDNVHAALKFASQWWHQHQVDVMHTLTLLRDLVIIAFAVIRQAFIVLWPYVTIIVKKAWELIKEFVGGGIKVISDIIFLFVNVFTGHWGRAWTNAKNLVHDAMKLIEDVIRTAITTFGQILYEAGKQVVAGFVSGIEAGASAVASAISSLASAAVSTAKSDLGIKSPSTIFHGIGTNLGLGLAAGMNASQRHVTDAAAAMAKAATVSASGTFRMAGAVRGGDGPGLTGSGPYSAMTAPYSGGQQTPVVNVILDGQSIQQAMRTGATMVLTDVVREQQAGRR